MEKPPLTSPNLIQFPLHSATLIKSLELLHLEKRRLIQLMRNRIHSVETPNIHQETRERESFTAIEEISKTNPKFKLESNNPIFNVTPQQYIELTNDFHIDLQGNPEFINFILEQEPTLNNYTDLKLLLTYLQYIQLLQKPSENSDSLSLIPQTAISLLELTKKLRPSVKFSSFWQKYKIVINVLDIDRHQDLPIFFDSLQEFYHFVKKQDPSLNGIVILNMFKNIYTSLFSYPAYYSSEMFNYLLKLTISIVEDNANSNPELLSVSTFSQFMVGPKHIITQIRQTDYSLNYLLNHPDVSHLEFSYKFPKNLLDQYNQLKQEVLKSLYSNFYLNYLEQKTIADHRSELKRVNPRFYKLAGEPQIYDTIQALQLASASNRNIQSHKNLLSSISQINELTRE